MTKRGWLIATVLTFITICAWVLFDILHSRAKVEVPQNLQEVIEPINPEFNTQILESIPATNNP